MACTIQMHPNVAKGFSDMAQTGVHWRHCQCYPFCPCTRRSATSSSCCWLTELLTPCLPTTESSHLILVLSTSNIMQGLDDIISVLQQNRLRWYGHALRKEDNDWMKKCMEYEVEVPEHEVDQRGLGERLCKKTVEHVNWTGWMPRIVVDGGSW